MTTPGFTAGASLGATKTFGSAGHRGRGDQMSEGRVWSSEVIPAHRPPSHIHGGCVCLYHDSAGRCALYLC
jgi:hypothetical protein